MHIFKCSFQMIGPPLYGWNIADTALNTIQSINQSINQSVNQMIGLEFFNVHAEVEDRAWSTKNRRKNTDHFNICARLYCGTCTTKNLLSCW